jgi:hypothetical protein
MSYDGGDTEAEIGQDGRPLVTLAEAAAITGRSLGAVRAVLRRDLRRPEAERRLKAQKNNAGEWLIAVPPGWRRAAASYNSDHAAYDVSQVPAATAPRAGSLSVVGRLSALEAVVAERLAALERDLAASQVALAKAEAERDAGQAVAAAREQATERVIGELREQLSRELARVTDLKRQLAEARRPWWARLVSRS